jgi:hypothetical protein
LHEFVEASEITFKGCSSFLFGIERKQVAVELHSLALLIFKKLLSKEFSQDRQLLEGLDNLLGDFLHEETKLDKTWVISHHILKDLCLVRVANRRNYS